MHPAAVRPLAGVLEGPLLRGPAPLGSGDVNGDGKIDAADAFYLIDFFFLGGQAP